MTELIECPTGKTGALVIPNGVETIKRNAFMGVELTSVTLPQGLEVIEDSAFFGCEGLTEITLPASLITCSGTAFSRCTGMTAFYVASGSQHFSAADGLLYNEDMTVLCRVPSAFEGTLTVPSGVTRIETSAFDRCMELTHVILPEGVLAIGNRAFTYSAVETVELPSTLQTIGYDAFRYVDRLTEIDYAGTMADWGNVQIGPDNDALLYLTVHCTDGDVEPAPITGSIGTQTEINYTLTPSGVLTVSGAGVWDSNAFWENNRIQTVLLDGVTEIGDSAFGWCEHLTGITIPNTVTSIKRMAFYYCRALESITIPSSVVEMGIEAFEGCEGLLNITFGGSMAEWQALTENTDNDQLDHVTVTCSDGVLTPAIPSTESGDCGDFSWTLENGVLTVNGWIFDANELPDSVKSRTLELMLGDEIWRVYSLDELSNATAFLVDEGNTELYSVDGVLFGSDMWGRSALIAFPVARTGSYTVPEGIEVLVENAFMDSQLTEIHLPDSLWKLELQAIYRCRNLEEITLPAGVTEIEGRGGNFRYCDSLVNFFVDADNPVFESRGGILYKKDTDTLFLYPCGRTTENITVSASHVAQDAFIECRNLQSVTFSEGVLSIDAYAFYYTGVQTISLPASLQTIGTGAFRYSPLSNITYAGTLAQWQNVQIAAGNENVVGCPVTCSDGVSTEHIYSGDFEVGIHYTLDEDGNLSVTGNGAWITAFAFERNLMIQSAVIGEGITSIPQSAFAGCSSLEHLEIPSTVVEIWYDAFAGCNALSDIEYNGTMAQWALMEIATGNRPLFYETVQCTDGNAEPHNETGMIGLNVSYALTPDGNLTVSGAGPWNNEAFQGNLYIRNATLEDGVTDIGAYAFYGCSRLTQVSVPSTVTAIGNEAFTGCTRLEAISFDGTMAQWNAIAIGPQNAGLDSLFINCWDGEIMPSGSGTCGTGLTWTVEDLELRISGTGAMENYTAGTAPWNAYASGIQMLFVEDGVTSIGDSAFDGLHYLWDVRIADSVTRIGTLAFNGCENLETLSLPAGLETIGFGAFQDCSRLTRVTIPEGVTYLGYSVFQNCTGLTSITLPASLAEIDDYAFMNCPALEDVYFLGTQAQWDVLQISEVENSSFLAAEKHIGTAEILASGSCGTSLTWTVDSLKRLVISGTGAMDNYQVGASPWVGYGPVSAVVENGVTSIGDWAFGVCFDLQSVSLPDTITSMGDYAFCSSGIRSITIPGQVSALGLSPFSGCTQLSEIHVSSANTSFQILGGILYNAAGTELICCPADLQVDTVSVPSGVTVIDRTAFSQCHWLQTVVLPDSVTAIGEFAFEASHVSDIRLPDGLTSIGMGLFIYCSQLTEIAIPDGVLSIGNTAFRGTGLTRIDLPSSLTSIGENAFAECEDLTEIWYQGSETQWQSVSIGTGNEALQNAEMHYGTAPAYTHILVLPSSLTSIESQAFAGLESVEAIRIPDSVTSIADDAFQGSSIVILTPEGSFAAQWADTHEIPYVEE